MRKNNVTRHGKKRMQQRAISDTQMKLIEMFGKGFYQTGGFTYAYIPEKDLAELRQALDKLKDVRLIYGESDRLVTAFHETRRIHKTQLAA